MNRIDLLFRHPVLALAVAARRRLPFTPVRHQARLPL